MDCTLKKTIAASTTNPEGAPPLSRSMRQGGDFDFPSRPVKASEAVFRPTFISTCDHRMHDHSKSSPLKTYFAVWGALAGDAPIAREAVARVYDLRSHLTLPEPDGTLLGPSHMASLTSAESAHEQWDWPMRTWGAALVADEAACLTKMPGAAELEKASTSAVGEINAQLLRSLISSRLMKRSTAPRSFAFIKAWCRPAMAGSGAFARKTGLASNRF